MGLEQKCSFRHQFRCSFMHTEGSKTSGGPITCTFLFKCHFIPCNCLVQYAINLVYIEVCTDFLWILFKKFRTSEWSCLLCFPVHFRGFQVLTINIDYLTDTNTIIVLISFIWFSFWWLWSYVFNMVLRKFSQWGSESVNKKFNLAARSQVCAIYHKADTGLSEF